MQWRDVVGDKLVSADEAVRTVQSGDVVNVAPYTTTPHTLCGALQDRARRDGLRGVRVDHPAALDVLSDAQIIIAINMEDTA